MVNKYFNKKLKSYIIIVFLTIIIVIGSLLIINRSDIKNIDNIRTNNLTIEFNDNIKIPNTQISNDFGDSAPDNVFSVYNNSDKDIKFLIKLKINSDDLVYDNFSYIINELKSKTSNGVLYKDLVKSGDVKVYNLKLWLDDNYILKKGANIDYKIEVVEENA